jgi:hypothetical protein
MITFALLLNHYQRVHAQDPNFSVVCGIDGCGCSYRNFYGYRSHVQRKHRAFYDNARNIVHVGNEQPENDVHKPPSEDDVGSDYSDREDNEDDEYQIKRNSAAYILRVKETYNLTQKAVSDVINNTTYLVREAVTSVCEVITNELKKITGEDLSAQIGWGALIDENSSVANPFQGMKPSLDRQQPSRKCLD